MRIRVIDGFTDRPFAGNPAGVCLLDTATWPSSGWMRRVAAELNHEIVVARPLPHRGTADWAGHAITVLDGVLDHSARWEGS